jgi:hypothetical protein
MNGMTGNETMESDPNNGKRAVAQPGQDLQSAFDGLKEPLRERIAILQRQGREAALAIAARFEAEAAVAEAALAELRLPREKRRRQRQQLRRLERLVGSLNDFEPNTASGRIRHLKAIGRTLRRVTRTLVEPSD